MNLSIGGIGFEVTSREMEIGYENVEQYLSDNITDIRIEVETAQQEYKMELPVCGEDLFCIYYGSQAEMIRLKGANGAASAAVFCENGMRNLRFILYPQLLKNRIMAESLFSFLPMRRILHAFDAFLLHSSRIQVDNKGILFSGPSGAGKTTQALLWKKYENVPHLCNDRTIVRYVNGCWNTYGYFQDGSMPICDNTCVPLGAIVFLQHGECNHICRINNSKGMGMLLGQIFMDTWDYKMVGKISELVLYLLKEIPVYSMVCVPDQSAVLNLKDTLIKEGVIR